MQRFTYWFTPQRDPIWEQLHDPLQFPHLFTASTFPNLVNAGYSSSSRTKEWKLRKGWAKPQENNWVLEWGKRNEKQAGDELMSLLPDCYAINPGLLIHPTDPEIAASLDLILFNPRKFYGLDEFVNVEIKCPTPQKAVLPETKQLIDARYIIQSVVQMEVAGLNQTILWVWWPSFKIA